MMARCVIGPRCSDTSAVGAQADMAQTTVPPQPRHASLNGGEPRNSSGSLAMFTAMRHASSRVRRCATLADFCAKSKSRRRNGVARC
jgi:hypothetical protein